MRRGLRTAPRTPQARTRARWRNVFVCGPPWNLQVGVEWLGYATPRVGEPYLNHGAHIIRIRRGKAVYFHAYEDSQKVAEACRLMAEAGIDEAAAAPITA